MLIFPTGFFSKPGFYYINIAKKCTKIHVFGKIAFWGWKNAFYPKTKVVPKTLSCCKTDEKIFFFKNIILGGGLRGLKIGKKAQNDLIHEPLTPSKNIFKKKIFVHLFYNTSKFLEQLLFLGKMHFFTPKRQFSQKHGFRCIFSNIHIIKAYFILFQILNLNFKNAIRLNNNCTLGQPGDSKKNTGQESCVQKFLAGV